MSKSNPPKNAITHGFYAADTVLPDENQQEFDELERAFFEEHCPEGISEKLTVSELASLQWKKRRFEAGVKQALQKQRDFDAKIDNWDVGALAKSQSKAMQTGCGLVLKHLEQLYQSKSQANSQANSPANSQANSQANGQVNSPANNQANSQANSQAVDFDKLNLLMKELNLVGSGFVVPTLQFREQLNLNQIERAFQPHILEKELKIQADFDRRIEKILKRLVMIKEIKRQYPAKSVSAKQIEATQLPPTSLPKPVGTETNAPDVVRPAIDPEVGKDTKH